MICDTHCHLYREYYDDLDDVLRKIKASRVSKVINNGVDRKSNEEVLELIKKYDFMYGAIGIHPEELDSYNEDDLAFLEEHINDSKVVAIGEIGLDYHYRDDNKVEQIRLFEDQLALAERYDKPVIIHSRDATEDTINILKKYNVRGVIHSFSGSYETALIYIKMGFLLGINGVVTFKNCKLKDVLAKLSLDNIVLETDSPYLTPVPYRGKRNDSSKVLCVAEYLTNELGISYDEFLKVINGNVTRIFDF